MDIVPDHIVSVYIYLYTCRFYENIFNMSGAANLSEQYGEWFTWDGSPRAKIFARNHTSVTNITTMINLMRYVLLTNDCTRNSLFTAKTELRVVARSSQLHLLCASPPSNCGICAACNLSLNTWSHGN